MTYKITIAVVIYLLSVWGMYKTVQRMHSKGGVFSSLDADFLDIIYCFTPALNTVALIAWYLIYGKKPKFIKSTNKFFNIKK